MKKKLKEVFRRSYLGFITATFFILVGLNVGKDKGFVIIFLVLGFMGMVALVGDK